MNSASLVAERASRVAVVCARRVAVAFASHVAAVSPYDVTVITHTLII